MASSTLRLFMCCICCRKQEEETLKMAIELSKSEASTGADDSSHGNNAFGDSSTGGVLGM